MAQLGAHLEMLDPMVGNSNMQPVSWVLTLGLICSFGLAAVMGANDISNSFGTSVGAGVLTIRAAVIIGGICNFAGSISLGASVSKTIAGNIVDVDVFKYEPALYMTGMLAALMASILTVALATRLRLPVSTTHAVVGAVAGFGLVQHPTSLLWVPETATSLSSNLLGIMLSWVISPLVAGAFSGIIYAITRAYVLRADPDQAIRRQRLFVALLISIILAVTIVFVCIRSPWPSEDFRLAGTILFSTMLPLAVGVVAYYWLLPRVFHNYAPSYIDVKTPLVHAEQHHPRRRERSSDTRLVIRSTSSSERFASTNSMAESAADASEMAPVENELALSEETADLHAYADQYSGLIEANFELLQVLSASYLAFSHGAQDVSNAIGPVTAILDVYRGGSVEVDITPPIWLMALGGAGICTGLFFFGHYVMSTLGGNLTKITPSRGFSVELGTGLAVLLASFLKLPISSTHCAVGAVVAVGLLNRQGTKAVSWSLLWKVVGSWIVTLPTAGLLSAGFYAALRPVVAAVELGPAEMLLRCFGNCSALLDTYA